MKRILVYSHDTFGLGNIRRMLEVSRHLVDTDERLSVLIVSGSPMLHAFRIPPRIDYIKLPCLARTLNGDYEVKYLDLEFDQTIRLRSNLIASAVLDFAPDLILVDKKPFGVGNELSSALDLIRRRGKSVKLVLLLRDILDGPEATADVWRKNGYFDAIEWFYDRVLVVGTQEVFDLVKEYQFTAAAGAKVRYCGYLRRPPGTHTRKQLRQEMQIGNEPLVLVTAGGGEDGYALQSTYLQGLQLMPSPPTFKTLLIYGPEMSALHRREILKSVASLPHVTVKEFTDDMMGCMDAADLVVAMGGYNTVCEILTQKKRAIIVPRVRPVQEQCIRAERMSRLGLLRTIHPDALRCGGLIRAVQEELSRVNVHARGMYQIDLDGMARITESIGELLYGGALHKRAMASEQRALS